MAKTESGSVTRRTTTIEKRRLTCSDLTAPQQPDCSQRTMNCRFDCVQQDLRESLHGPLGLDRSTQTMDQWSLGRSPIVASQSNQHRMPSTSLGIRTYNRPG